MGEQKTILVVDDEADLQQLVKMVLKSKGYNVETADNGEEALEMLKSLKPDLIVLDMNMPIMGGIEFYQKTCDEWSRPKYPVLVLTARANMEQLFKELEADGFMSKPFEIEELLTEVETILQKKSGSSQEAKPKDKNQPTHICVADNDPEACGAIGAALLTAGFEVNLVRNGTEAIDRVAATVPDLALVKLTLPDFPGDIVISKLKKMAKTQAVKFILYTQASPDKVVAAGQTLPQNGKDGIERFVIYQDVRELVGVVNEVLKLNR
ncbi:MAG: response regulator [Candidatus Omnitrophica bacterium]|nr:response regulator [Candidatus Omnitrophota bacterium]